MKLIRDGYIKIIERSKLDVKIKTDEQKLNLILDKIKEEAIEFLQSNQRDPEELADLMQVIIDWGNMNDLGFDIVNHLRKQKLEKLGGFTDFITLKNTPEIDNDDISEEHF